MADEQDKGRFDPSRQDTLIGKEMGFYHCPPRDGTPGAPQRDDFMCHGCALRDEEINALRTRALKAEAERDEARAVIEAAAMMVEAVDSGFPLELTDAFDGFLPALGRMVDEFEELAGPERG